MRLASLEFGSLLSYSPRGPSDLEQRSKNIMRAIKGDEFVLEPPILMSDFVVDLIKESIGRLPFSHYFEANPILVPTPSSALTKPGTLWVPQRLAGAMVTRGYGRAVVECLERVIPVRKSATAQASDRPKASEHYSSMEVQKPLSDPDEILLIDDIVTRGATLVGAANKLADVYPNARIRAFAFLRAISPPDIFQAIYAPCIGTIKLSGTETFRRP